MSQLKTALHDNTFVCIMEFVPKSSSERFASPKPSWRASTCAAGP